MECKNFNYNDWAGEYEQQLNSLQHRIEALKNERHACTAAYKIEELSRRINSLYSMYLECRHTALLMRKRAKEAA